MPTSVATLRYDTYTFASPLPQIGIRDGVKRLGESGFGPGSTDRKITIKGKLYATDLNAMQTKIWDLKAAFQKSGKQLYWHDGVTARINNAIVQPESCEIPEDWGQYENDYTITLNYIPLGDTHYAPVTVSYNGYTFTPIPVMGREYSVNRPSPQAARDSSIITVTLQGFVDKGTVSGNFAEWDAILAAMATDGTLTYGPFVQSVRAGKASHVADVGDRRLSFTLSFDYDTDIAADGVVKMSSTRAIDNSERVAIHYLPFSDDARVQRTGRNGQRIVLTGYIIADTLANAKIAAQTEIASLFPVDPNAIEESRKINETAAELKVDWNVTRFYPSPVLTGGVYGGAPVFP